MGAITPETTFEKDDWRRSLNAFGQPIFEGQNFLDNLNKVDRLKEIAGDRGYSVAQLALAWVAWVASEPTVSVALFGIRRSEEMEENAAAGDWEMSSAEREEIRGGGDGVGDTIAETLETLQSVAPVTIDVHGKRGHELPAEVSSVLA